jgi:hypothetical protein
MTWTRFSARTGDAPTSGVLVIGRATLDGKTPWHIRRHAAAHPLFPHDAIGDQWFDDAKFNAYTGLGKHVGQRAIDAMAAQRPESAVPQPIGHLTNGITKSALHRCVAQLCWAGLWTARVPWRL